MKDITYIKRKQIRHHSDREENEERQPYEDINDFIKPVYG
jgi:hypothetical protein